LPQKLASEFWQRLLGFAEEEISRVLRQIPEHLRETAQEVTLVYEAAPNSTLIKEGIEEDTLGLFVGDAFADAGQSSSPLPPQIILFLENLWDVAEENEEFFRDEVRATYLHELGHYLGLDEDGLTERGLD
jgi:predicted Zn-dependent protease with MMP-like domain